MKPDKRINAIFIIIIFFLTLTVALKSSYSLTINEEERVNTYGTYEQAKKILKEVMKDYYYKNPYLQYSYAKMYSYGNTRYYSPEEITSQDIQYATCSGWAYNVYYQAFGMKTSENIASYNDSMPAYADSMMASAKKYYDDYSNNPSKLNDGTFLLYYENSSENIKYVYDNGDTDDILDDNATFKEFVKLLQPGDILLYGHAIVVYDVIDTDNDGVIDDALLLNINGNTSAQVRSGFGEDNYLYYESFAHREGDRKENYHYENNDYLNVEHEGALKWRYMNAVPTKTTFMHGNNYKYLSCNKAQCAIIRPFYNYNGQAVFNYGILPSFYQRSQLRSRYPSIRIEKTVDVGDNNSVNRDDILTYTINIDDIENENNIWKKFKVVENIDTSLVDLVNGSCTCDYNSTCSIKCDENQISWIVGNPRFSLGTTTSLVNRKNAKLTYQVKVKNNAAFSDTITATGNFYGYVDSSDDTVVDDTISLTTGTVENKIVQKVSESEKSYTNCWNDNKDNGHNGLSLIADIYSCTRGEKYNDFFDDFDFNTIFYKATSATKATANAVYFKNNNIALKYKSMNLNNYWNGTIKNASSKILPRFTDINTFRAKTIKSSDFKEGDVLIYSIDSSNYTSESGLYAYIYINGKFVGVNGTDDTQRNEFTRSYYGDDEDNIVNNLYGHFRIFSNVEEGYTTEDVNNFLEFANYQTLFDKDYYVILRPELVIKDEESISIESLPSKREYYIHEKLNLDGININLNYNNGEKDNLPLDKISISGFDSESSGVKTIIISYDGMETSFTINVIELKYTVTFDSNGGSSVASQTINYNEKAIKPSDPIKIGYTFKEWQLNGSTYDFNNTAVKSNITLIAVWDKDETIIDNSLKTILENNGYNVANSFVSKFTLGDNITSIKNRLGNNIIIETNKAIISTGAVIKKGNESYIVVIKGDLNGDGIINSGDLLQMRKYLLEEINLTGAYKQAGIIESNNEIKSLDLLRLRQFLLEEYTFK